MSGFLAACGTYYADRSAGACLECRGGRSKRCRCAGCRGGQHSRLDLTPDGKPIQRPKPRTDNSDMFRRFSLRP